MQAAMTVPPRFSYRHSSGVHPHWATVVSLQLLQEGALTLEPPAGPRVGDVAGHLIHIGSNPQWSIRIEGGTTSLGINAESYAAAARLVIEMAGKLGAAGWLEDEPGHWQLLAS
jgi:hypothetical protein